MFDCSSVTGLTLLDRLYGSSLERIRNAELAGLFGGENLIVSGNIARVAQNCRGNVFTPLASDQR